MTPEDQERIAQLKAEIDSIRTKNEVVGDDGIVTRYNTRRSIDAAIRVRCRAILYFQDPERHNADELPDSTIGLLRAVGYVIEGLV